MTPPNITTTCGPKRSTNQASTGTSQVSVTTKIVNAIWMAARPQWYLASIGSTNSVHPYCRLAIIAMQTMPMASCSQRKLLSVMSGVVCGLVIISSEPTPLDGGATGAFWYPKCQTARGYWVPLGEMDAKIAVLSAAGSRLNSAGSQRRHLERAGLAWRSAFCADVVRFPGIKKYSDAGMDSTMVRGSKRSGHYPCRRHHRGAIRLHRLGRLFL